MFQFRREGEGKGEEDNPLYEFASKLAAEKAREAKEQARKKAEWQAKTLPEKVLIRSGKIAKTMGVATVDFLVAPITLWLLYAATYRTGAYALPPVPSIWAVVLPYLMWRIVAFEIIVQVKKINRQ